MEKGHFNGPRVPFGALVDCLPSKYLRKKCPKFGPSAIPGLFVGWHMHAGGKWSGDILVVPLQDLKGVGRKLGLILNR